MPNVPNLIGLGMPPEHAVEVSNGTFDTVTSTNAVVATAGGIRTKMAINQVGDTTPTASELATSFGGNAAAVGAGFVGIVKDNDTDTNCFVVVSNGTSYFYLKFTKAS
jgi:hypothetical protein